MGRFRAASMVERGQNGACGHGKRGAVTVHAVALPSERCLLNRESEFPVSRTVATRAISGS
jgi:hypothetical protein